MYPKEQIKGSPKSLLRCVNFVNLNQIIEMSYPKQQQKKLVDNCNHFFFFFYGKYSKFITKKKPNSMRLELQSIQS